MLSLHRASNQPPDNHLLSKGSQMPRKASGISKANAKGGAIAADGTHILNSNESPSVTGGIVSARGGSSNRGAKRRRTSNNVNSSGTEIYGSGTIVAANPFDDDHGTAPTTNHTSLAMTATNKMMVMSPSQAGIQMPSHHHQHFNHQQHVHPTQHQIHHNQQPQHAQQQPSMLPHQIYSPHHQNNHYNAMQQSMSMHPRAQLNTPPGHMAGPLPPQPLHQDHVVQQQHPSPLHNQGGIVPIQHHQNYGPPPNQQQQPHMIGTSTPPHLMGGPVPSHSPYNTMHHQQGPIVAQPQQTMTPQPQQQQSIASSGLVAGSQQQPPPPHHIEQMSIQQQPYATNHNVYCGKCQREVYQNEPNIICKAGCKLYFHISCSGLTPLASDLLMKESLAEWACDRCTSGTRRVPFVKYNT